MMKRYLILWGIMWLVSVLTVRLLWPLPAGRQDRDYLPFINRLHQGVEQTQTALPESGLMTLDEGEMAGLIDSLSGQGPAAPEDSGTKERIRIRGITVADRQKLTPEQSRAFFMGMDIDSGRDNGQSGSAGPGTFMILPVEDSERYVRYEIETVSGSLLLPVLMISFPFILFLILFFLLHKEIIAPLREMLPIPERLARGNYLMPVKQYKNKLFHQFFWGLDMLRLKLEEQKEANLRLEKERRTLAAGLAHDIKTPLASVMNYSGAVKDGIYTTREEIEAAMDIVLAKAADIGRLTDELLAASAQAIEGFRAQAKEHYFNDLLNDLDQAVRNRIGLLEMNYKTAPPIPDHIVWADRDRWLEVCGNIIENAVKYGDLGSLTIGLGREEIYTAVSIENTGSPVPAAELKHIFTGFYRGSNAGDLKGHGLGLYIVKELMHAMDGEVYAENTAGGVRIVLLLKRVD